MNSQIHERSSNLELYRIIVMVLIVSHHYVVNSGLMDLCGPIYSDPLSEKPLFLILFGGWGKTGINCFVLMTGYFMCRSQITVKKFIKLITEVLFYNIVISTVFWVSGYEPFSVKELIKTILPFESVRTNFTGCYLIFFLFIPFLNMMIHQLDEKKHLQLLGLCAFTYIFFGTFHRVSMNYVSWYMVLFVIGSYLRLYPKPWFDKTKLWGLLTLMSVVLSIASIIVCAWLAENTDRQNIYYFVSDSNSFLAVANGVCLFMFFKNLKVPQSKFVNTVATSTFGVLCIHANSDVMRRWLWKDLFDNVGAYEMSFGTMALHAVLSVAAVFASCIVIDYLRIKLFEEPLLNIKSVRIGNESSADILY